MKRLLSYLLLLKRRVPEPENAKLDFIHRYSLHKKQSNWQKIKINSRKKVPETKGKEKKFDLQMRNGIMILKDKI